MVFSRRGGSAGAATMRGVERIASLLPSTTEIACALGFEAALVGRSHEVVRGDEQPSRDFVELDRMIDQVLNDPN
jgi:hypothetical protein